jgi:hypothetical protein
LLGIAFASPGGSSSPAGTAVGVLPDAQGQLDGLSAELSTGDGVFMGQRVITGNKGQVQILFSDNTHLVVGPQASLVISTYLMRNDGNASKVVVDALSGTFRFMTGNSPKSAYQIKTPTGTLGVRGTAFDFTVDPVTGQTTVLLYHGGVQMCDKHGCEELAESCAVGVIGKTATPDVVGSHDKRRPGLLKDFPYLESQQPLKAAFRVEQAGPCSLPSPPTSFGGRKLIATAFDRGPDGPPSSEPSKPSSSSEEQQPSSSSAEQSSSEPPPHGPPPRKPPPTSSEPPPASSSEPPPASSEPPPTSSEPPPTSSQPPPTSSSSEHNNNGLGNGGEGDEGPTETNNPGKGNGSNGTPGNGNGNGGVGNGNGNGNAKH